MSPTTYLEKTQQQKATTTKEKKNYGSYRLKQYSSFNNNAETVILKLGFLEREVAEESQTWKRIISFAIRHSLFKTQLQKRWNSGKENGVAGNILKHIRVFSI